MGNTGGSGSRWRGRTAAAQPFRSAATERTAIIPAPPHYLAAQMVPTWPRAKIGQGAKHNIGLVADAAVQRRW
jgi:hypothetical protein